MKEENVVSHRVVAPRAASSSASGDAAPASADADSGIETIHLAAGGCTLTVLPQLGGKIAGLRVDGRELLQAPLLPYGPRTRTMGFDQGDAGGWDECLPSVSACRVPTESGPVDVPDHGDLWRVGWETILAKENRLVQRAKCFSLPLTLERELTLLEKQPGWRIQLDYKLTNSGSHTVPWSWSAHPSYAVEPGDRIVLPEGVTGLRLEGSGGDRLGRAGDRIGWPVAKLADAPPDEARTTDLSVVLEKTTGIGDKLFAGPLAATQNWCLLERPSAGVRLRIGFDPAATPYLGLWLCYGGWPVGNDNGAKQFCVAIEPTTAPTDSLAALGPWSRSLHPGQTFAWSMTLDLEPLAPGALPSGALEPDAP